MAVSTLCVAHCLALPAASLAPLAGTMVHLAWAHWIFAGLAAALSIWTLSRPRRGGRSRAAVALAASGVVLLIVGASEVLGQDLQTPMTVLGALVVAAAHALNLRFGSRRRH